MVVMADGNGGEDGVWSDDAYAGLEIAASEIRHALPRRVKLHRRLPTISSSPLVSKRSPFANFARFCL